MTLAEIKQIYKDIFFIEEDMILDVIIAVTIASQLEGDPIWLLVIGPSSGGKTELINSVSGVSFVHPVSNMTENTFLSNMRLVNGEEASLLHRIGTRGVITMKDYTSILAMRSEKRDVIISQMREIYDGHITKEAGNGKSESWTGKINWIGGVTEMVYLAEEESAGMGRRTINYVLPEQNRKDTTRRSNKNNKDIGPKRKIIQDAFAEYINMMTSLCVDKPLPEIPEDFVEELITLADFITLARTPTSRDRMGRLTLVTSAEMPMRVYQMFATLTKILMTMHDGEINDEIRGILRKIAMDSLPKQRRITLSTLAKYKSVTTKGMAQSINYPTDTVRLWLEDVNVLNICTRANYGGVISGPDTWIIKPEYKELIVLYDNLKTEDADLAGENESSSSSASFNEISPLWVRTNPSNSGGPDDKGQIKELEENAQRAFDQF